MSDKNRVNSIEEYNMRIKEGLNYFLESTDGRVVENNTADSDEDFVLTIVAEDEKPNKIGGEEIQELNFKDCGGVFEFAVIGESHFKISVHSEPEWDLINPDDHIGEAVNFIIGAGD